MGAFGFFIDLGLRHDRVSRKQHPAFVEDAEKRGLRPKMAFVFANRWAMLLIGR
jgi:hypothetical protein